MILILYRSLLSNESAQGFVTGLFKGKKEETTMNDPHEFDMLELDVQMIEVETQPFFTDEEIAAIIASFNPQCETELFSLPVNKTPGTYTN